MKKTLSFLALNIALISCKETPLQRADNAFDASVESPTFKENRPVILFEKGYNTSQTTNGLYQPLVNLLRNDGYELKTLATPVRTEALNASCVFVIINAKEKSNLTDTTTFTKEETENLRSWVLNGGSLLLIADRFPFDSASFLTLSDAAHDMTPTTKMTKDGEDTKVQVAYSHPPTAKEHSQGIAFRLGKGKVVCLGEAAMLAAQTNSKAGKNFSPELKKLCLNIVHWLTEKG